MIKYLFILCIIMSGCASSEKEFKAYTNPPGPYDMELDRCLRHERLILPGCNSAPIGH